jgi:hypothetical protein
MSDDIQCKNKYGDELIIIPRGNTKRIQKLFMLVEECDDKSIIDKSRKKAAAKKRKDTKIADDKKSAEQFDALQKELSNANIQNLTVKTARDITNQATKGVLIRKQQLAYMQLLHTRQQHRKRFGLRF